MKEKAKQAVGRGESARCEGKRKRVCTSKRSWCIYVKQRWLLSRFDRSSTAISGSEKQLNLASEASWIVRTVLDEEADRSNAFQPVSKLLTGWSLWCWQLPLWRRSLHGDALFHRSRRHRRRRRWGRWRRRRQARILRAHRTSRGFVLLRLLLVLLLRVAEQMRRHVADLVSQHVLLHVPLCERKHCSVTSSRTRQLRVQSLHRSHHSA